MSSGSAVLASSLSSLAAELSQSKRLLKLHFPESAPDAAHRLVPYQIEGDENVCGAVRYRLQCLGNDVHVPLKDLQGQPVAITTGLALCVPTGAPLVVVSAQTRAIAT